MIRFVAILAAILFWSFGCSHLVSEELRLQADAGLSFVQLLESPEKYKGQTVMLGGVIVKTSNFPDRTEIEVVEKELDLWGYPDRGDSSPGRFIFTRSGFLDPQIYANGRYVVGGGKVEGARDGKVDQQPYRYPVISAEELRLLRNYSELPEYGPYYGPFGPYPRRGRLGTFPYYW